MRRSLLSFPVICVMVFIIMNAHAYGGQVVTKNKPIKPYISNDQGLTIRTVEGIVQNVTNDSIQVRGEYYSISGIPLLNPAGEYLKKTSLSTGKKIEIFFREGTMTSIVIYENMVE